MSAFKPRRVFISTTLAAVGIAGMFGHAAADSFDGDYRGTERTTVNANVSECVGIDRNDKAIADGSFEAQQTVNTARAVRVAQIKGWITGGNLEADIGTNYCGAHISLKKM